MSDWPMTSLGSVTRQAKEAHEVVAGRQYDLLGIRMHGGGVYRRATVDTTSSKATTLYRAHSGQFIYNRMFAWGGSFAVVPPEEDGSYVSNEFPLFECDESRLITPFLWLYFQQPEVWASVAGSSTGTTASRNRWKEDLFARHEIPLPPVEEQRYVVCLLAAIDRHFAALEAEVGALNDLLCALAAPEWEGSAKSPIGQLGVTVTGSTPKTSEERYWNHPDVRFVAPGDLSAFGPINESARHVSEAGASAGRRIEGPALSVVCIGATIGKIGLLRGQAVTNQQINTVTGLNERDCTYLGAVLASTPGRRVLLERAGTTALPLLSKSSFNAVEVPWPGEEHRALIADAALSTAETLSSLRAEVEAARSMRLVVLQALMGRQIEIPDTYRHLMVGAA